MGTEDTETAETAPEVGHMKFQESIEYLAVARSGNYIALGLANGDIITCKVHVPQFHAMVHARQR